MSQTHGLKASRGGWKRHVASTGALALLVSAGPALAASGFTAVTASGDDGNRPSATVDGNLATRWSSLGVGQWLRGDLGAVKSLSAVDIAWHEGNRRVNTFVLATSTDGATWTTAVSTKSSGTTANFERYTFATRTARYVRVTVNGNSLNAWASIAEWAAITGDLPAPVGRDRFGVTMLYPSKAGGEAWTLADNATSDRRFNPQDTLTRNSDGSWKVRDSQVRLSVFTSTGYDDNKIPTYDRDVLASRGYMQAANDWKNVEMTGFVKLNSASVASDNFDWYARGGKHNNDHSGCEGSSYKAGLHYDGRARWQKETWHVSYEQTPYKAATSALKGRWVGFKSVMRNVTVSGRTAVKLEMYVNENADRVTWKKVYDHTDAGAWGGDAQHCGGATGPMPITWGGPIAVFRWDNANDVDFKWLSVREIQP
ncbi:discoidin domain-containing protein [Corallococcus sp. BB11-1]|uniref:discoidin domain-containing protein n=1 Tax=Corallococcus sp. BB11-1 TaxID=2996783 RepID=UPI002271DBFE|nr:discoidin domain-containing protein [Corallococcus sp. BB11-1]MCY1030464.1 discoidin domain-containing protein [Corallococcus sp. BB11-1]